MRISSRASPSPARSSSSAPRPPRRLLRPARPASLRRAGAASGSRTTLAVLPPRRAPLRSERAGPSGQGSTSAGSPSSAGREVAALARRRPNPARPLPRAHGVCTARAGGRAARPLRARVRPCRRPAARRARGRGRELPDTARRADACGSNSGRGLSCRRVAAPLPEPTSVWAATLAGRFRTDAPELRERPARVRA